MVEAGEGLTWAHLDGWGQEEKMITLLSLGKTLRFPGNNVRKKRQVFHVKEWKEDVSRDGRKQGWWGIR